jgi:hypothetical protein
MLQEIARGFWKNAIPTILLAGVSTNLQSPTVYQENSGRRNLKSVNLVSLSFHTILYVTRSAAAAVQPGALFFVLVVS